MARTGKHQRRGDIRQIVTSNRVYGAHWLGHSLYDPGDAPDGAARPGVQDVAGDPNDLLLIVDVVLVAFIALARLELRAGAVDHAERVLDWQLRHSTVTQCESFLLMTLTIPAIAFVRGSMKRRLWSPG